MTYFWRLKVPLIFTCLLFLVFRAGGVPLAPEAPSSSSVSQWLASMGNRREGSREEGQVFGTPKIGWVEGRR